MKNRPLTPKSLKQRRRGFTLAELLISLAILGVIATFTIPKVLSSQQNGQKNAEAKEVAAMISAAFQKAQLSGQISSASTPNTLTPYMNYVNVDTAGTNSIDAELGGNSFTCSAAYNCLKLHNGGTLLYDPTLQFAGNSLTNGVWFLFDPDSSYSGSTTGSGKAVGFYLFYNGKVVSYGDCTGSYTNSAGTVACGSPNVSWFSW